MANTETLTPASATAYVRKTIATWGAEWAAAEIKSACLTTAHGSPVCVVETSMGDWDVWAEPDGTLYGEC